MQNSRLAWCLGIDDVFSSRAATVRERFWDAERHRFLTGATLKNRNGRETLGWRNRLSPAKGLPGLDRSDIEAAAL